MGELIFIVGGARSGKSRFAETRARELGGDEVLYVATAQVGDEEMRRRVEKHRQQRPGTWRTLEASQDLGSALVRQLGGARVVLVDCLSMLVATPLMAPGVDAADVADEDAWQEISRGRPSYNFSRGRLSYKFSRDAGNVADEEALQGTVEAEVTAFLECAGALDATFIVVSNEVGMGVVPPTPLGRLYRDLLGRANQQVAAQAGEVTLMVAGIPTRVK